MLYVDMPANITHNHHLVVYFPQVEDNCFCISAHLLEPGAESPQPQPSRNVRAPEGVAQMKSLQTKHGLCHALLVQVVVMCMELL